MMAAVAYAAAVLVLAGCAAWARTALRGHQGGAGCLRRTAARRATGAALRALIAILSIRAVRVAVLRARWAWRCRTPPRNDGAPLGKHERGQLVTIVRGWDRTAPPERSRT